MLWPFAIEHDADGGLIRQVEVPMLVCEEISESARHERPLDRRSNEA
jgi:hypothetical protein